MGYRVGFAYALLEIQKEQLQQQKKLHGEYQDFGMVIAQLDGRPTEERFIAKAFKEHIKKNKYKYVSSISAFDT